MGSTYQSTIVNAPVDKVWERIRNFHDLSWATNVVEKLEIVGDNKADQVGTKRVLNGVFHETLQAVNELDHSFQYTIDDAPGTPVAEARNYVGKVSLLPITEGGGTFVEWKSSWDDNVAACSEFCHGIYVALLGDLKKSFE
jgi:carbon monoxide dehydrogenase subunit G